MDSAEEFAAHLADVLDEAEEEGLFDCGIASIKTYEEQNLLTKNEGLSVTLDNGAEFQITVVRSKPASVSSQDDNEEPG